MFLKKKLEKATRELENSNLLEKKLADAEKTIANGREAFEEMQSKLEALVVEKCALEDTLEASAKTESEEIVDLKALKLRFESLAAEKRVLEEKLEEATRELENSNLLEEKLAVAEKTIANGKEASEKMHSNLEALLVEKCALEDQLKASARTESEEIIALKIRLESAEQLIEREKIVMDEKQRSFETLIGEKCALEEDLRARLDAAQKTISDGKLALDETEKDSQSNKKSLANLKELYESLSAEKTDLEEKLEEAVEDHRSLVRLLEMIQTKKSEEDETCSLEVTQVSQQSLIELKVELEDSAKKNVQLQKNVSKLEMLSDSLKKYSEELESKVESLTSQNETLQEDVKKQTQLYMHYMLRSEELEDSVKSAVTHKEAAQNTLESVLEKVNKEKLQLEKELEVLQSRVSCYVTTLLSTSRLTT